MLFRDRIDAGRRLARELRAYADRSDVVVLALPRGGVPVAAEVAKVLHVPLDIFLVRKLGVPGQEELALGAIANGDIQVLNQDVVRQVGIGRELIEHLVRRERRELARREHAYRNDRPPLDVLGKIVILIDDGLATGASMRAAVMALRQKQPARIVAAVPAAARDTCEEFRQVVDEMICAETPEPFYAVGTWYDDFSQTTDDEVRALLKRYGTPAGSATPREV